MVAKNKTSQKVEVASPAYGYSFPVIRGTQASTAYFVAMCPLRMIPKIFHFNDEELPPDMRAQRRLNRTRVPDISSYITSNPSDYVLSALTASIDGKASFMPLGSDNETSDHGILNVSMDAKFIINDGQHRRAAIEKALETMPELGSETIAVVFYLDPKLNRCQQMFADLNRYAIRPSKSLGILYDYRDAQAKLTKILVNKSNAFSSLIEMEKTTLSLRSKKLFTLSAIYGATNDLLAGMAEKDIDKTIKTAIAFWNEIAKNIAEWDLVSKRKITAGEVRQEFIHTHGVVLQAFGRAGNHLLSKSPNGWKSKLSKLAKIDWRKNNPVWEGRALVGGKVSKSRNNVILVTNYIKSILNIPLSPEERQTEDAFARKQSNG